MRDNYYNAYRNEQNPTWLDCKIQILGACSIKLIYRSQNRSGGWGARKSPIATIGPGLSVRKAAERIGMWSGALEISYSMNKDEQR